MKGSTFVALIVSTMLLGSPVVHATEVPDSGKSGLNGRFKVQLRPHSLERVRLAPITEPRAHARSGAEQSADALRLPDSAFSPGTVTRSSVLDNTFVDDQKYWPRDMHSADYKTWGRVTGYLQVAEWQPSSSPDKFNFNYAGSIFATSDGARNAWQDGSTYPVSKYAAVPADACPGVIDAPCTRLIETSSSGPTQWADLIQDNQCLIETLTYGPNTLFSAHQSQIASVTANIDRAALNAAEAVCGSPPPTPTPPPPTATPALPTPTPTPTSEPVPGASITIDRVQIDPRVPGRPLNQGVTFLVFYHVSNAGPDAPVGSLRIIRGGSALSSGPMRLDTLLDGVPYFSYTLGQLSASSADQLAAQITLTLGSAHDTRTVPFTIGSAVTLDKLQLLQTSSGSWRVQDPTTQFGVGACSTTRMVAYYRPFLVGSGAPSGTVQIVANGTVVSNAAMQPGTALDGSPFMFAPADLSSVPLTPDNHFTASVRVTVTLHLGPASDTSSLEFVLHPCYTTTAFSVTGCVAACPATTISIKEVGLMYRSHGQWSRTKSLHKGDTGLLYAIYSASDLTSLHDPSAKVSLIQNGRAVPQPVVLDPGQLNDGTQYFSTTKKFSTTGVSHIVADFTLSLGTSTTTKPLVFTVQPGHAKT